MKKGLRRWLGFGVSAIVLGLIIYNLRRSPEWRRFRWDRFWSTLMEARLGFLLVALAATWSTYLLRALRWKIFLNPLKKASLWILLAGQILGFSSIYLIGRPGEFVRPAYIARKVQVSFTSQLALLVLERIYDSVFMVLLFAASVYFVPMDVTRVHGRSVLAWIHAGGQVLLVASALMVGALVVFRLRAERLTEWLLGVLSFLPSRFGYHLERFLRSFAAGLGVIRNWKDFLSSLALTAALWILNAGIFWLVFRSLGEGLEQLPWVAPLVVLFCAALGLVLQFPGIGGGYQVGIVLALRGIFGVGVEVATGAAFLTWIMISVPCIVPGIILLVFEGLTFRRLAAIAEDGRAATMEKV